MSLEWVLTGALVFIRMAGVIAGLPIFNADGVPKSATVFGALGLSALLLPTVPAASAIDGLPALIAAAVLELLYGGMLSFGVRAAFAAVTLAGELISIQTGLALASLFNPLQNATSSSLGVLTMWLSGLAFVLSNLHLRVIEIVAMSFHRAPPGELAAAMGSMPMLIEAVGSSILLGVQLAGPVLAMVFVINVVVAILARLAPRMNVFFSIGMTVTGVVGLVLFFTVLPWLLAVHQGAIDHAVGAVGRLLGA